MPKEKPLQWDPEDMSRQYGMLYDISDDGTCRKARQDSIITIARLAKTFETGCHKVFFRFHTTVMQSDNLNAIGLAGSSFPFNQNAFTSGNCVALHVSGQFIESDRRRDFTSNRLQSGDIVEFALDCDARSLVVSVNGSECASIDALAFPPPYRFAVCFRHIGNSVTAFTFDSTDVVSVPVPTVPCSRIVMTTNISTDAIALPRGQGLVTLRFPALGPQFDMILPLDDITFANCRIQEQTPLRSIAHGGMLVGADGENATARWIDSLGTPVLDAHLIAQFDFFVSSIIELGEISDRANILVQAAPTLIALSVLLRRGYRPKDVSHAFLASLVRILACSSQEDDTTLRAGMQSSILKLLDAVLANITFAPRAIFDIAMFELKNVDSLSRRQAVLCVLSRALGPLLMVENDELLMRKLRAYSDKFSAEQVQSSLTAKPFTPNCKAGHKMTYFHVGSLPPTYRGGVLCDSCQMHGIQDMGFHHCSSCRYDLCPKCVNVLKGSQSMHSASTILGSKVRKDSKAQRGVELGQDGLSVILALVYGYTTGNTSSSETTTGPEMPSEIPEIAYQPTPLVPTAGHRIRLRPSLTSPQVASIYPSTKLLVSEVLESTVASNGCIETWGKLHPKMMDGTLRASQNFQDFDIEKDGWLLLSRHHPRVSGFGFTPASSADEVFWTRIDATSQPISPIAPLTKASDAGPAAPARDDTRKVPLECAVGVEVSGTDDISGTLTRQLGSAVRDESTGSFVFAETSGEPSLLTNPYIKIFLPEQYDISTIVLETDQPASLINTRISIVADGGVEVFAKNCNTRRADDAPPHRLEVDVRIETAVSESDVFSQSTASAQTSVKGRIVCISRIRNPLVNGEWNLRLSSVSVFTTASEAARLEDGIVVATASTDTVSTFEQNLALENVLQLVSALESNRLDGLGRDSREVQEALLVAGRGLFETSLCNLAAAGSALAAEVPIGFQGEGDDSALVQDADDDYILEDDDIQSQMRPKEALSSDTTHDLCRTSQYNASEAAKLFTSTSPPQSPLGPDHCEQVSAGLIHLTAAGDINGGGTGREVLANLLIDGSEDWNKWFDPARSNSSWVEASFISQSEKGMTAHNLWVVGYGLCSANDAQERDPVTWDLVAKNSQGQDVYAHSVDCRGKDLDSAFTSRFQWRWYLFPRPVQASSVKLNIRSVRSPGHGIQLGSFRILHDPLHEAAARSKALDEKNTTCESENPTARIGFFVFSVLMREVLSTFVSRVDAQSMRDPCIIDGFSPSAFRNALAIVKLLSARPAFEGVIIEYLLRPLCARAGLRVKIIVESALSQHGDAVASVGRDASFAYNLIRRVNEIESEYVDALNTIFALDPEASQVRHSQGSSSGINMEESGSEATAGLEASPLHLQSVVAHYVAKLSQTCRVVGSIAIANYIVQTAKVDEDASGHLLMAAIQGYLGSKRESKELRAVLHCVFTRTSSAHASKLDVLWRHAVTNWVVQYITSRMNFTGESSLQKRDSTPKKDSLHARSSLFDPAGLVNNLISKLHDARKIQAIDFSTNAEAMRSAGMLHESHKAPTVQQPSNSLLLHGAVDMAFSAAYRRLSRSQAIELSKSLAASLSFLLDASKQTTSTLKACVRATEQVCDLVRILCAEAQDFQTYYELLLARRLLRNRYISITTEKNILDMLPTMSKSSLMIRDIELTEMRMHDYRNFISGRLERNLSLSSHASELVFSLDSLSFHCVTGSVWPSSYVNAMAYSNVVLPPDMRVLADEFEKFFSFEDIKRRQTDISNCPLEIKAPRASHTLAPTRRLYWCHGAGTATVKVNLGRGLHPTYVSMTVPQLAVLFVLASIASEAKYSESTRNENSGVLMELLSAKVGIQVDHLTPVIASLASTDCPILTFANGFVSFAEPFLAGKVGSSTVDEALSASSLSIPTQSLGDEKFSIGDWRDELIDASIVRTLKNVVKNRTGDFGSAINTSSDALSTDTLVSRVREDMKDKVYVSAEDIVRRTEHLVATGIISKNDGWKDSFRTVAYKYFDTDTRDVLTEKVELRNSVGSNLFHHLFNVLKGQNVSRIESAGDSKITREEFCSNLAGRLLHKRRISTMYFADKSKSLAEVVARLYASLFTSVIHPQMQKLRHQYDFGRRTRNESLSAPPPIQIDAVPMPPLLDFVSNKAISYKSFSRKFESTADSIIFQLSVEYKEEGYEEPQDKLLKVLALYLPRSTLEKIVETFKQLVADTAAAGPCPDEIRGEEFKTVTVDDTKVPEVAESLAIEIEMRNKVLAEIRRLWDIKHTVARADLQMRVVNLLCGDTPYTAPATSASHSFQFANFHGAGKSSKVKAKPTSARTATTGQSSKPNFPSFTFAPSSGAQPAPAFSFATATVTQSPNTPVFGSPNAPFSGAVEATADGRDDRSPGDSDALAAIADGNSITTPPQSELTVTDEGKSKSDEGSIAITFGACMLFFMRSSFPRNFPLDMKTFKGLNASSDLREFIENLLLVSIPTRLSQLLSTKTFGASLQSPGSASAASAASPFSAPASSPSIAQGPAGSTFPPSQSIPAPAPAPGPFSFATGPYGFRPHGVSPSPFAVPPGPPGSFGKPSSQPSPFGVPSSQPSPFAVPSSQPSPFGVPSSQPSPFAVPSSQPSPFGVPSSQPSPFAVPPGPSGSFGKPSSQPGPFGSSLGGFNPPTSRNVPVPGAFGAPSPPSAFQPTNEAAGSRSHFVPTPVKDNNGMLNIQSICAMPAHESKSYEELRLSEKAFTSSTISSPAPPAGTTRYVLRDVTYNELTLELLDCAVAVAHEVAFVGAPPSSGRPTSSDPSTLLLSKRPHGSPAPSLATATAESPAQGTPASADASFDEQQMETPPSIEDIKAEIRAIYTEHCPAKLLELPALFNKYDGRELTMLRKIQKKYLKAGSPSKAVETPQMEKSSSPEVVPNACTELLHSVFNHLDCQHRDVITVEDFSSKKQATIVPSLDPEVLYRDGKDIERRGSPRQGTPRAGGLGPDDDEDMPPPPTPIGLSRADSTWNSLSTAEVTYSKDASISVVGVERADPELQSMVDSVCSIIQVSPPEAYAMLLHFHWDFKRVVELYVDDPKNVRRLAGMGSTTLPPFLRHDIFADAGSSSSEPLLVSCGICMSEVEQSCAFALCCEHYFCGDCWAQYIATKVADRQVTICCPSTTGCEMTVQTAMVSFLCGSDVAAAHHRNILRAFLEDRQCRTRMSYCKNPRGCEGVTMLADDAIAAMVSCGICGCSFCVSCDMPPHAPATCAMVKEWEERGGYLETGSEAEKQTRLLKQQSTKPCPKCGVRIEKNGGCPHMDCKKSSGGCGYQFCWECGGPHHTSSSCSNPKVPPSRGESGSLLAFDEMDKKAALHFTSRTASLEGRKTCLQLLRYCKSSDTKFLQSKLDAWTILSEAQAALGYACIVLWKDRTPKLEFIINSFNNIVKLLQNKCEKEWLTPAGLRNTNEAHSLVRMVRLRLRDFVLVVGAEIVPATKARQSPAAGANVGGGGGPVFGRAGQAFGGGVSPFGMQQPASGTTSVVATSTADTGSTAEGFAAYLIE